MARRCASACCARARTTGDGNMIAFAMAALELLEEAIDAAPGAGPGDR